MFVGEFSFLKLFDILNRVGDRWSCKVLEFFLLITLLKLGEVITQQYIKNIFSLYPYSKPNLPKIFDL